MDEFKERTTREYRQKQMFSKEELEKVESLCVHEQPAFCNAACPLKLDARAFTQLMAAGDFTGARAMLEHLTPFPRILAAGCSAPCASRCRLAEDGEGVNMSALERAAMTHGAPPTAKGLLRFKKKKTAVIYGADLFSLALAGELCGKTYPLTFYVEAPDALSLLADCAPFLSGEDANAEAKRFAAMDIKVIYGAELSRGLFDTTCDSFDIRAAARSFALELCPDGPDAVTLACNEGLLTGSGDSAPLASLFDARRAALSADRQAQGMEPTVSRGHEGPTESRLYTNMTGVEPSLSVAEHGVYTREEALCEAKRCISCRCEECIKGCAYLQHYKKFPRILTREIYNNVSIIMGDHMMNKPINSCSLCAQCTVTCPNGYDMAEVCLTARENMVTTGKMPLAAHEFALFDMLQSNGEAFLCRSQPGYDKCRYVFFPGCQAGAIAPEAVYRAYSDLCARLEGGVALMLGCCGVIAHWAGRYKMFEEQTALLKDRLRELGDPVVIAGCPTCKKTLSEYTAERVVGVWQVLEELGLPEGAAAVERSVVLHDSCGARFDGDTRRSVRALAEKLGCTLIDTEFSGEKTACCGYGGLVGYTNREVAAEMTAKCAEEHPDAPYVTYCMACRDRLARDGRDSSHLLELVYGAPAGAPPDISEKRKNRLTLKRRLLKEVWKETMPEDTLEFPLTITPEARAEMDDRMILDTDVIEVMRAYRQSGEAVLDTESGLLITRHRMVNVTFWVRFLEADGGYIVRGAYSHRMTVK